MDPRSHTTTPDLDDPVRIAEMVHRFYRDVAQDDLLGPVFDDVARVDWREHLATLTDFWCRVLLARPGYHGNPYRAHRLVHERHAFTTAHFDRWLDLFLATVDAGWQGPGAEQAKAFATKVARVHHHQLVVARDCAESDRGASDRGTGASPGR